VKELLPVERSPRGAELRGKTGTGTLTARELRLGWYVAHLRHAGREYVAAVVLAERTRREPYAGWAGKEARGILQAALRDLGRW
jgi:beta-lactamase class D